MPSFPQTVSQIFHRLAITTANPTSAATTPSSPILPAPETCFGVGAAVALPSETLKVVFVEVVIVALGYTFALVLGVGTGGNTYVLLEVVTGTGAGGTGVPIDTDNDGVG